MCVMIPKTDSLLVFTITYPDFTITYQDTVPVHKIQYIKYSTLQDIGVIIEY